MVDRSGEILRLHGAEEYDPAVMETLQQRQRRFDGCRSPICHLRPEILIVWFDRRLLLRDSQFEADVGIHMTVGNVMCDLTACPSAFTIGDVELLIGQSADGLAKLCGRFCDLLDQSLAFG